MLEATGVVVPIPLSKKRVSAFVEVHESVEEPPVVTVAGVAPSVQVGTGGGGTGVTATVASHVAGPLGPVAVPMYVVVAVGETAVVPPGTGVLSPMPLSKENEVAFVVVHVSIEGFPAVTAVGFAERVHAGDKGVDGGVTVIVAEQVAEPPGPVTVAI